MTDAWCNAGTYELTARFTPASVSADNYEPYEETFTVTVEKSTPTITGTLTYSLKQTEENATYGAVARLPLALATISSDSTTISNPNAAFANANGKVQGSWAWEDELVVPTKSGQSYNVKFIPKDTRNYNEVLYSAAVNLTFYSSVQFDGYVKKDASGVGFRTGNRYQFGSDSDYGFSSGYSAIVSTLSFDRSNTTGYVKSFYQAEFSKGGIQQVVPLGVFIEGSFAVNEKGDGYTKVISGTYYLWNNALNVQGLDNEMKDDYFSMTVTSQNGLPKKIELKINIEKIIPLGAVKLYYVAGLCTEKGNANMVSYKVTNNGTTYYRKLNESNVEVTNGTISLSMIAPTVEPTLEPTLEPTDAATLEPTLEPTVEPTAEPTLEPTAEPTTEPTSEVTPEPTDEATVEPTAEVTTEPTDEATAEPTTEATLEPTTAVTVEPTVEMTAEPTAAPVVEPTSSQDAPPAPVEEGSSEGE